VSLFCGALAGVPTHIAPDTCATPSCKNGWVRYCGCGGVLGAAEHVSSRSLSSDFCDLQFFMLLVRQLHEAGIPVAIASFGLYNVIQVR
jgi:hypothetical protein